MLLKISLSKSLCVSAEASRVVLQETGLLPHVNAGVLTRDEFAALKTVSGILLHLF